MELEKNLQVRLRCNDLPATKGPVQSKLASPLRGCTGENSTKGLAKQFQETGSDFVAGSVTLLAHIMLQGI